MDCWRLHVLGWYKEKGNWESVDLILKWPQDSCTQPPPTHTHKALKLMINDCKLCLCACAKSSSVCQVTTYWPSSQNQVRSSSRPNKIEDLRTNITVSSQLSQQRTVTEKCSVTGELPLRSPWARIMFWGVDLWIWADYNWKMALMLI